MSHDAPLTKASAVAPAALGRSVCSGCTDGKAPARRSRIAKIAAGAAIALATLTPSEAHADDSGAIFGVAMIVLLGATDVGFSVYDAAVARNDQIPSSKAAVAELIVSGPQTAILGGAMASFTVGNEPEVSLGILPFGIFAGALTTHAIWRLGNYEVGPNTLFFVSPAIATDTLFTASALTAMFGKRRVFTREMGIAEVVLTAPQVIAGAYELGLSDSYWPGWTALTAWSGALLIHGAVSIALNRDDRYDGAPSSSAGKGAQVARIRPRIEGFGPAPIAFSGERQPAFGFVARGSF